MFLFTIKPKFIQYKQKTEVQTQLLSINHKSPQCKKKKSNHKKNVLRHSIVDRSAPDATEFTSLCIENSAGQWHAKLRPRRHPNKNIFFKIPDLVYRTTAVLVVAKNRRQMPLQTSFHKSDSTLQQSVLCPILFQFHSGSLKPLINMSKLGLNIIQGISNLDSGVFYKDMVQF